MRIVTRWERAQIGSLEFQYLFFKSKLEGWFEASLSDFTGIAVRISKEKISKKKWSRKVKSRKIHCYLSLWRIRTRYWCLFFRRTFLRFAFAFDVFFDFHSQSISHFSYLHLFVCYLPLYETTICCFTFTPPSFSLIWRTCRSPIRMELRQYHFWRAIRANASSASTTK